MHGLNLRVEIETVGIQLRNVRDKIDVIISGLYANTPNPDLSPKIINGLHEILGDIDNEMNDCTKRAQEMVVELEQQGLC